MYTTYMLTIASLKMFLRNRQALFFSIFMPMLIMFIFGSMNFDKDAPMKIGLVYSHSNATASKIADRMRSEKMLEVSEGTQEEEIGKLKEGDRKAVVVLPPDFAVPGGQATVYLNQGRPMDAAMASAVINFIVERAKSEAASASPLSALVPSKPFVQIKQESVSNRSVRYIEFLLPGIIAMSVMQMSVFSVAFVFAQYREKGVLKRLLATPVKPVQFVTANILTRLTMSLAQASIFTALGLMIFHIQVQGAIWLLGLVILLGALMFLGLGFTISGLCKTMETVPVLSNIIVFPMLFLGNVFFPMANSPAWMRPIANNLPLTYFSESLREVMTYGAGLEQIKWKLAGVLGWAVGLITLAMLTFRMQEKEA